MTKKTQKATFALGCFWEPDDQFSQVKGVAQTTVGYSGGTKENPTYHDLGDHTETVEILFDPEVISFKELIKKFWELHDPTVSHSTQYKSVIFYHTPQQKKEAEQSKKEMEKMINDAVVTEIVPASTFTKAEEYHQKYLAKLRKRNPLAALGKLC